MAQVATKGAFRLIRLSGPMVLGVGKWIVSHAAHDFIELVVEERFDLVIHCCPPVLGERTISAARERHGDIKSTFICRVTWIMI
jgi:hypothetical protein